MNAISSRTARLRAGRWLAAAWFAACVGLTAWQEPAPGQQLFVLVVMLCSLGVAVCLTARPALALVLTGVGFVLLKALGQLKLRYLDSSLMPADFIYFVRSSLVETLEHYPPLLAAAAAVAIGLPLAVWLLWRREPAVDAMQRWSRALVTRALGVAAAVFALHLALAAHGPFAQVHNRNAWQKLSDAAQLTNFFVNLEDDDVHLPPRSSDAIAEQAWAHTAGSAPPAVPAPATHYPDIVQVLEESTFDPSVFAACNLPPCRVGMFRADAHTRAHGALRVHTFGGGTWVSEFASLTGLPQSIFGPGGMYAPYVLAPRVHDTLPLQLQRLGYLTVAIYPTAGGFINGRNAYRDYGFEQFYDVNDLGLQAWKSSDAQMFAAAWKVYQHVKQPGRPVFMMILTLAQHGPHDIHPLSSLPPPYNRGLLHGLPEQAALNFDTYLSRLQASDRAMRELEARFLHRPQPTVLMTFGDHQPAFSGLIRELTRTLPATAPASVREKQDYLTYYMLKSNLVDPPLLPSYPLLDIAYLPSMVLQAAGLPTDPYFAAETTLRDRCDGLYTDCAQPDLLASYHAWIFDRLHVYQ